MSLQVRCPGCGTLLKAPEDRAGKKARCNKCHASFRIPKPTDSPATPSEADEDVPMAVPVDDLETPSPDSPAAARPAFGSAAALPPAPPAPPQPKAQSKPKAAPLPPQSKPKTPPLPQPSKPKIAAIPPPPPPPKPEPEVLSLDDDEPAKGPITTADASTPTVSESSAIAADPFAFAATAPAPKDEPKGKRREEPTKDRPRKPRRDADDTPPPALDQKPEVEESEPPARPRYVRPGEQKSSSRPLVIAGVLALLALGATIAAIVVSTRKDPPPETIKKEEKKDEPPPAPPADKGGEPVAPKKEPTEPAKKEPAEPKKEPEKTEPKKDAKLPPDPPRGPVTRLELSPTIKSFQIRKPNAKPELVEAPSGAGVAIEVPYEKVVRAFAPRNRTTHDVIAVWISDPGSNGTGQRLTVDAYSSTTGKRVGRFEVEGDGGAPKCDVSTDATLFAAAGPGGKVSVWNVAKMEKTLDGYDPYADKPSDKKTGLTAVFFAKSPQHLVTVSTAGVVHLHEIASRKTLATFTPAGQPAPGRVVPGKTVAADDDRSTLVLAAGNAVYQIATAPPLDTVWKLDLGGEAGRSLGIGVAGNPGRIAYAFETDNGKGKKERAVMLCLPRGTPEFVRWPDAAGEPTGVEWAGTDLAVIATNRGAVWAEYDSESKRFLVLAMAEVAGGKALHTTTERAHWYLVPKPDSAAESLFLELTMPPDGLIDYRNAAEAKQPVHAVKLDAKGLWR